MSKSNTFENDIQKLIFQGTAIANVADNAAASPLTNLYIALHTADPGEAGSAQTTSEATYGGYARQAVARSAAGFTVTNNVVTPVNNIEFPTATSGSETITHITIGTAASGSGKILYRAALNTSIAVTTNVTPRIENTSTITEE